MTIASSIRQSYSANNAPNHVSLNVLTGNRITLQEISWTTYQNILDDAEGDRNWRIAYDHGNLEFIMPRFEHEVPNRFWASLIEAIADELELEVLNAGSLRLDREDLSKAIEPDTCFYIQNELAVRNLQSISLPENPPPDLAIESDYTNSSINKLGLYAALGVPELWRIQDKAIAVYVLQNDKYERRETSLIFPMFPIAEFPILLERSQLEGQRSAVRIFRQLIRDRLAHNG
jgi:Uma2 family endonuclease